MFCSAKIDADAHDFLFFEILSLKFIFYLAAIKKLEQVVNTARLMRIVAAWQNVAKDSKRTKEYFKVYIYLEI